MSNDGKTTNDQQASKALLVIVFLSGLIAALNTGTMYVAYVEFMDYFQAPITTVQWVAISYALTAAMLTPMAGYFAQRYSLKPVFILGLVVMGLGSLLCMLAQSIHMFIFFRALQGIASGILTPLSLAIIYQLVPKEQQGQFLSFNLMAMSLGPAIGPTLSGVMIDRVGWQGIFLCNVPIIALTGYLVYKNLPQQPSQDVGSLDYKGMATVFIGTMLLLLGFNQAAVWGWYAKSFWCCTLLGCGFIVYFVRNQLKSTMPLLNFKVFSSRKFTISVIISATLFGNITAGAFLLPYYLQNSLHLSATQAGAVLFFPAICMVVATPISGWLYRRFSAKALLGVGVVTMLIATERLAHVNLTWGMLIMIFWMSLRYIGVAIANVPAMDYGLGDVAKQWSGHATAMNNWIKSMFASITLSLITALLSIWNNQAITTYLSMGMSLEDAMTYGSADAVSSLFMLMAGTLVAMVLLILSINNRPY